MRNRLDRRKVPAIYVLADLVGGGAVSMTLDVVVTSRSVEVSLNSLIVSRTSAS